MISLILDTSTDSSLIALAKNHRLLASTFLPHSQNLSNSLLPTIQALLQEHKIDLKELFKICVGVGPGSYTGTRIAVAVAETLALALSIPLYPFCSLLAFLPPELPGGPFAFITNTQYKSWFLLKGYLTDGLVHPSFSQHILPEQDVSPFLQNVPSLLSFPSCNLRDKLPTLDPKETHLFQAAPNFFSLLSHLSDLEKSPPEKPDIVYLHQF